MPLTSHDLSGADGIYDLSPLAGMPLTSLNLSNTQRIYDLSPLKNTNGIAIVGASDALLTTLQN